MASPGIGYKSYLQFGREATWANAVAATKRIGILSHSVKPDVTHVRDQTLTGSLVQRSIYNVMERVSGTINMYLEYENLMMLFDGAFGTATYGSNGGASVGANPYTHTWAGEKEFFSSFTMQFIDGNIVAGTSNRGLGMKVKGFKLSGEAGGMAMASFDVVGKRMNSNQTVTALSQPGLPTVALGSHVLVPTDGGGDAAADIITKSWEFSFESGMDDNRQGCESAYILEPIRNGVSKATIKYRKEFRTVTSFNNYTQSVAESGTASIPLSTQAGAYLITMTIDSPRIVEYSHGVDGFGVIYVDVTAESTLNTSSVDHGASLVVKNTQVTITT